TLPDLTGTVDAERAGVHLTGLSANHGPDNIATTPAAGHYEIKFYSHVLAPCTTGSYTVKYTLAWTDPGLARQIQTGSLTIAATQIASSFLSGVQPIILASGSPTIQTAVTGTCSTGSGTFSL